MKCLARVESLGLLVGWPKGPEYPEKLDQGPTDFPSTFPFLIPAHWYCLAHEKTPTVLLSCF